MTNRPIQAGCIAAILLMQTSAAGWQSGNVEVLWSGVFRPYFTPPRPGDPDLKLGHGYIGPRPVRRTDRVPGRVGVTFGVLFIPRLGASRFIELRQVDHFPEPGLVDPKTGKPMKSSESRFGCSVNAICFSGFNFDQEREIIPGKWRFEVFLSDEKLLDNEYVVEADKPVDANARESTFEKGEYRITLPGPWRDESKPDLDMDSYRSIDAKRGLTALAFPAQRPWTEDELLDLLRKMATKRVEAARRAYGSTAAFEAPEFSTSGKLTYVRLWGVVPGRTQIASLMVGEPSGVKTFTYVFDDVDVPTFRAEAEQIFRNIQLK